MVQDMAALLLALWSSNAPQQVGGTFAARSRLQTLHSSSDMEHPRSDSCQSAHFRLRLALAVDQTVHSMANNPTHCSYCSSFCLCEDWNLQPALLVSVMAAMRDTYSTRRGISGKRVAVGGVEKVRLDGEPQVDHLSPLEALYPIRLTLTLLACSAINHNCAIPQHTDNGYSVAFS